MTRIRKLIDNYLKTGYNINIRFNSMLKGKAQKPEKGKI